MAEKKVSVRLVAENGRQVRAELEGVGKAGADSFKRMSREVDTAGIMLRRLAGIAAGALSIRQTNQKIEEGRGDGREEGFRSSGR